MDEIYWKDGKPFQPIEVEWVRTEVFWEDGKPYPGLTTAATPVVPPSGRISVNPIILVID